MQQRIRAVVSVPVKICAHERIHVRFQLIESFSAAQIFARPGKIRPEALRHPLTLDLLPESGENLSPLSDGLGTRALSEICDGQAVVHISPSGANSSVCS